MRPFRIAYITIFLVSLLGGCSSFVVHERFEHPVRKVALLSIPNAGHYFVEQITPNVLQRSSVNFENADDLFANEGFDVSVFLERAIVSEFAKRGIDVVVITVPRDNNQEFVKDVGKLPLEQIDAVLDVLPSGPGYQFGAYGERSLARLRPMLGIRVQAVSAHTRKLVYSDQFGYGYHVPKTSNDDKYVFEDAATLASNPGVAVAGLKHAATSIVAYLLAELGQYTGLRNR
jgi:hypothetical protein